MLIVFLCNPGVKYAETRHNAGWILGEEWMPEKLNPWQKKFNGLYLHKTGDNTYLKPGVFMNKSGESVFKAAQFFKLKPEQILVVHDDLELPFGTSSIKMGGGLGGHNGLKSVKQNLGSSDFWRLRIGIGRPARGNVSSFVLSRFSRDEEAVLDDYIRGSLNLLLENLNPLKEEKRVIIPY